jgi:hypothetical protein
MKPVRVDVVRKFTPRVRPFRVCGALSACSRAGARRQR